MDQPGPLACRASPGTTSRASRATSATTTLEGSATLRRQIALAKGAGLHGFVFYFYWFNGRRLLDAPLEALLADPALDMPFCLMWANENWTRRWDGSDEQVLVSQDYRTRDEPALIAAFARHFADPRYIRLGGRPVLMVYPRRADPGHGGHGRALAAAVPRRAGRGPGVRDGAELRRHRPAPVRHGRGGGVPAAQADRAGCR